MSVSTGSEVDLDRFLALCASAHTCVIVQREARACCDIGSGFPPPLAPFAQFSAAEKALILIPNRRSEDEDPALQSRQRRHAQLHATPLDVSLASDHASQ